MIVKAWRRWFLYRVENNANDAVNEEQYQPLAPLVAMVLSMNRWRNAAVIGESKVNVMLLIDEQKRLDVLMLVSPAKVRFRFHCCLRVVHQSSICRASDRSLSLTTASRHINIDNFLAKFSVKFQDIINIDLELNDFQHKTRLHFHKAGLISRQPTYLILVVNMDVDVRPMAVQARDRKYFTSINSLKLLTVASMR